MIGAAVTKSKYRPADMLYLLIINKITSFKHCGAVVCVSANEGGSAATSPHFSTARYPYMLGRSNKQKVGRIAPYSGYSLSNIAFKQRPFSLFRADAN